MARGGFVGVNVAVDKLFIATVSRDNAKRIIMDSLESGALTAKGKPILQPRELSKKCNWTDAVIGSEEYIPIKFWKGLVPEYTGNWNWESGEFVLHIKNENHGYMNIAFKEKDINQVILMLKPSINVTKKKSDRIRHPTWDNWIAAAANVAAEQRICADMKRQDLLDLIDSKLKAWGYEGKEHSTVGPAAKAILDSFRLHPPVKPLA
jgi:hypothetical protein